MKHVLVVADAPWVRNEVHAALTEPGTTITDMDDPTAAGAAVVDGSFDLVIVDLQVGSMGGMAVTRSIREATGLNDQASMPVIMLLDRAADAFLAKRAGAAAWLTKPFTSHDLAVAIASMHPEETSADDAAEPVADEPSDIASATDDVA